MGLHPESEHFTEFESPGTRTMKLFMLPFSPCCCTPLLPAVCGLPKLNAKAPPKSESSFSSSCDSVRFLGLGGPNGALYCSLGKGSTVGVASTGSYGPVSSGLSLLTELRL